MTAALAFYKGPPSDLVHTISHYGIRLWTWSRWSHAELVIDGWCYSSSSRDGGVRRKQIDLDSGRWDVVPIDLTQYRIEQALQWFAEHDGAEYDYRGILRFVLPPVGHSRKRWICFEAIGASLGMAGAHRLTANDLYKWAVQQ